MRRALCREFDVVANLLAGKDFHEGVRAMLIDKDKTPLWHPEKLAGLSKAELEKLFDYEGDRLQFDEPLSV